MHIHTSLLSTMLSRVPRGHHCWRRAYSSLVEEAQASSVAAISSRWPQPYRPNELPDNGPDAERRAYRNQDRDLHMKAKGMDQVINVKLPNEIGGLPHAFAILRAIEKKYGPILDHSFRRSFITSRPDDYRSNVQVSIANSDAHDRLRHEGEDMLEVPLARFDRERPGGAGLEDILPILLHQSRDEPSLYSDHTVVIKRVLIT
ncbi:hypothetical protein OE88DRAFT_204609 [Heliocybe sulcata]|uniref:Uncharacterized protein n=1 Tax=Heliocybe sulcata TaxID=5364 RepID=A0A5C3N1T3_9AGAM|nr:hypothetical protein OE88DRAFT_204609 [Heliocybe sulcata]